ncbi:type II secretion system minor pseudopilin GspJ [Buttiauxella massiliensis]|uniref:type II secretion system minor pseudopilin GspJ n=1 Tax=Buttiauxella massiliensis TaxID=2831590 RepID=UPI00125FA56A|nr:type II secretion system minor pseudopilin GspJ [Buttiauxella massiliensis]
MNSNQRGFTLLEVLVALVIFALLTLTAQAVFQGVLRNNAVTQAKISRLTELSFAMQQLENDFIQSFPRTVREAGAPGNTVFSAADGVIFTRSGWFNPDARLRRSELQKLGWRLRDSQLERVTWRYPDNLPGTEPNQTVVLKSVRQFRLRYYRDGHWLTQWTAARELPQAVEVTLELPDYGLITRRFLLAASENAQ